MANITRAEAVALIKKRLEVGADKAVPGVIPWHYGRLELTELLDLIYGEAQTDDERLIYGSLKDIKPKRFPPLPAADLHVVTEAEVVSEIGRDRVSKAKDECRAALVEMTDNQSPQITFHFHVMPGGYKILAQCVSDDQHIYAHTRPV